MATEGDEVTEASRPVRRDTGRRARRRDMLQLGRRLSAIPHVKRDVWRTLPVEGRIQVLQQTADMLADYYGIDPVDVQTHKGGWLVRGWYDRKHTESIGEAAVTLKSPRPALSIVFHETRHAVQRTYRSEPQTFQQRLWALNERCYFGTLPMLVGTATSWAAGAFKPLVLKSSFLAPVAGPVIGWLSNLSLLVWAGYRLQPLEVDAFGFQHAARGIIRKATGGRRYQLPCRLADMAKVAALVAVVSVSQVGIARSLTPATPVAAPVNLKQTTTGTTHPPREAGFIANESAQSQDVVATWTFSKTRSDAKTLIKVFENSELKRGKHWAYADRTGAIMMGDANLAPHEGAQFQMAAYYPHGCSSVRLAQGTTNHEVCW